MLQNRSDLTTSGPQPLPAPVPANPEVVNSSRVNAVLVARWLGRYVPFLVIVALVVGYERVAPPEHKLSAIIGAFEGNSEAAVLRTKLEAAQQTLAMQNAEKARMENEINFYKAELEKSVAQFKAALDLQKQVLAKRQEAVIEAQKDKLGAANFADIIALLLSAGGDPESAQKAAAFGNAMRRQAYGEIDSQAPAATGTGGRRPAGAP